MNDSLSSWEHHKWALIWKFIPIKPNWYIIHSTDYKDRYVFSFFNYWKFERVFVNRQMPIKGEHRLVSFNVVNSVIHTINHAERNKPVLYNIIRHYNALWKTGLWARWNGHRVTIQYISEIDSRVMACLKFCGLHNLFHSDWVLGKVTK